MEVINWLVGGHGNLGGKRVGSLSVQLPSFKTRDGVRNERELVFNEMLTHLSPSS